MVRKDTAANLITAQSQQEAVSDGIENYELPKSLVVKLAKAAIPDNAKLQKDTALSLVKSSTVFINFLAATAHDIAASRQHRSVSASDILKALEHIQFGDMVEGIQEELKAFKELSKTSKKGGRPSTAVADTSSLPPTTIRVKAKAKDISVVSGAPSAGGPSTVLKTDSISGTGFRASQNGAEDDEDEEMADTGVDALEPDGGAEYAELEDDNEVDPDPEEDELADDAEDEPDGEDEDMR